jgi:hypothetical protein
MFNEIMKLVLSWIVVRSRDRKVSIIKVCNAQHEISKPCIGRDLGCRPQESNLTPNSGNSKIYTTNIPKAREYLM